MAKLKFDEKDNPLKDMKVIQGDAFDPGLVLHKIWHGTDEGYKKVRTMESIKERQKRESNSRNF